MPDQQPSESGSHLYDLLADQSRDIILLIRREDGRILSANTAALEAYGYSREEMSSLTIFDLRASEERDLVPLQMSEADERGALFETVHCRKDAGTFPVEVSARGATVDGTRTLVSIIRDITERKRAELSFRRNDDLLAGIIDTATDGIIALDDNLRIRIFNPAAEKLFGYSVAEMLGQPVNVLVPEPFRAAHDQQIREFGRTGFTRRSMGGSGTVMARDANGREFPVEASISQFDVAGRRLYTVILRDVEARKRAEAALSDSLARLQDANQRLSFQVDRMPLAYISWDVQHRVIEWNASAERIFGWTAAEVVGRDASAFLVPDDFVPTLKSIREGLASGAVQSTRSTNDNLTKDGRLITCEWFNSPLTGENGEVVGFLSMVNDITEQRQLESQFLQAQKMEAVGRLAGGVAHDFNNMIGVILGYGELIEQLLNPLDPLRKHAETIIQAAERSAKLTQQLLAFARKQVVSPVPLNLNEALAGIHGMLMRLIGEDIAVTLCPSDDLWTVRIDPTQVDQILANLSTNARDAIADVGSIIIETSNAVLDETYCRDHVDARSGEFVSLAFSDTGAGMDKATLQRVFEPFFTTKPAGEGTGLGLATVFGIVKQNNGFINVYSEPGSGTTFRLYLPRYYGEADSPVEKPREIALHGSETVLIVEDEEQLLELARTALAMHGYNVLTANSPGDAILLCERTDAHIDLLISDVVMPGMNGKEMKEKLDAIKPGMKCMFMSGYTPNVVAHRGILDAGVEFLEKPFTPMVLARKVREVLNR